jgi:hypothetical protein
VSSGKETMELPVSFASSSTASTPTSWGLPDLSTPGKPLFAGFHRCTFEPSQVLARSVVWCVRVVWCGVRGIWCDVERGVCVCCSSTLCEGAHAAGDLLLLI